MSETPIKRTRAEVLADIEAAYARLNARNATLLANIKANRDRLESCLANFKRSEADLVYRFYHQSWKVFDANRLTGYARDLFIELAPDRRSLDGDYLAITDDALSRKFHDDTNKNWCSETLPILQAFWHSKYFLEQMLTAANELDEAPSQLLSSGWAAVLYLFDLRHSDFGREANTSGL